MKLKTRFWQYIGEQIARAYGFGTDEAADDATPPATHDEAPNDNDIDDTPSDTPEAEGDAGQPAMPAVDVAHILLARMGCEAKWQDKDGDMSCCDIGYMGGHFVLRMWDRHPYTLLMFPFFFAGDTVEIDMLRSIINRINMESIFTRIVTSVSERTGDVQCHIMSCVVLDEPSDMRLRNLRDALNSCFAVRHDFERYYREAKESPDDDPEMDAAARQRDLYLLSEQAWAHHEEQVRVTADQPEDNGAEELENPETQKLKTPKTQKLHYRFTLREMMRRMFDWQDIENIDLRIVLGTQVAELRDAADYEPIDALVSEGGAVLSADAVLLMDVRRRNLELFDESIVTPQRPTCAVTAMMRVTHSDPEAVYVQVTLAREAAQNGEVRSLQHPEQKGDAVTFIIARDKSDDKSRHDEFRFVLDDAHDKVSQGRGDQLTEIQEVLLANEDSYNDGYNLYWGETYVRHERYAEALVHFTSVYEGQRRNYLRMSPRQRARFQHVMYCVGLCYARLRQYEKAFYYLDMAAQGNNNNHVIELINCLVNSGDPRADQVLSNVMSHVQEQINENQDDDDFDIDTVQPFLRFLNMRRAYLYIEQRQWALAEDVLNHLLDDDETQEFAMNELAYAATIRATQR